MSHHAHVWPVQYAIEADPGQCTASFPVFPTEEDARAASAYLDARRPDLPPCRILRREIGPWTPVGEGS